MDMRARLETLPPPEGQMEPMEGDSQLQDNGGALPEELEDTRRRLEWLEEQSTVGAASEKVDHRQIHQMQNTICDMLEQVSNIKQRTSRDEAANASLLQQVQQLQERVERRGNDDSGSASARHVSEVDAKVGAVSAQVADIAARLLEVEGDREFARENESLPGVEVSAVSVASEVGSNAPRGLPPLPRGADRSLGLQQQLEAVAAHLEAMDELADRVAELEQRNGVVRTAAEEENKDGFGGLGGFQDQVSFGPTTSPSSKSPSSKAQASSDALTKEVEGISQEVSEMRGRLM